MNKKEFMKQLKRLLPEKDRRDILLDYEEHFLSGLNDGKTEEEIVDELGSPEEVAKEFGYIGNAPAAYSGWAIAGIILFDLFIGISILSSLFSLWIALWLIPISCFFSGIALVIGPLLSSLWVFTLSPWYFLTSAGISLLGFSVLSGVGMVYVTKGFYKAVKWYVMLHAKIFGGQIREDQS